MRKYIRKHILSNTYSTAQLYLIFGTSALCLNFSNWDLLLGKPWYSYILNSAHGKDSLCEPGRCGRVVSVSACQAGGLWFKSGILPLLKHACGESNQLYTPAEVSHQRWISGNIYHVCLRKVRIRQNPLWLWNPEETSPEVRNRGISGPKNGHVSNKNF